MKSVIKRIYDVSPKIPTRFVYIICGIFLTLSYQYASSFSFGAEVQSEFIPQPMLGLVNAVAVYFFTAMGWIFLPERLLLTEHTIFFILAFVTYQQARNSEKEDKPAGIGSILGLLVILTILLLVALFVVEYMIKPFVDLFF